MTVGDGTVGKALDVLDRVATYRRPVRFSELLEEGGYPKATLYRLLRVLVSQRLLSHDAETGQYELGGRLVRLAHSAWSDSSLAPVARPHLERLDAEAGMVVHLAQLDGGQVLYVDKLGGLPDRDLFSAIGRVAPAFCTGVGKAMMAFLPPSELEAAIDRQSFHRFTEHSLDETGLRREIEEIRRAGVAYDRCEHEPGIACIAMPVLSRGSRVLGAVSLTSTTRAGGLEGLEKHAGALAAAVRAIEQEAQIWRFPERERMRTDQREG